ncbi:GIY-YIG nuclease family protein [Parasphingorhabdus sp.]|uniref:GIY-YIG nuclease family protein n=1 Tax=Parasphingorhabdus sp. TaxID=2709688 RepID=UPI003A93C1E7
MTKSAYVYLTANRHCGKTYLGVTSNLAQRVYQHRNKLIEGYSKDHNCMLLVWFEAHDDIQDARARMEAQEMAPGMENGVGRRA